MKRFVILSIVIVIAFASFANFLAAEFFLNKEFNIYTKDIMQIMKKVVDSSIMNEKNTLLHDTDLLADSMTLRKGITEQNGAQINQFIQSVIEKNSHYFVAYISKDGKYVATSNRDVSLENIIGIGGTDDLMLDYNLNSGDVDLLSCKYSEEFVNTLLDAVDEFVNN